MLVAGGLGLGLVILPLLYVVVQYNGLIALRNHIRESWSGVDTELKRRHELIPNLVAIVKAYAAHEREVLENVVTLRGRCLENQGGVASQSGVEQQLVEGLQRLMVLVEHYPQLKADQHFLALQKEWIQTENRIQAARRFYNGNVRDYRIKREAFPSSLVAAAFDFGPEEYFQVEPGLRELPENGFDGKP